jgi:hypothetical protein
LRGSTFIARIKFYFVLIILLFSSSGLNAATLAKGDINGDGFVDLADAITVLKIISQSSAVQPIYLDAAVNNDGKLSMTEAIYIMQALAGLRITETYSLSGTIYASGSQALRDVIVTITGGLSTTTDANGHYTFSGLQAGKYTLTLEKRWAGR